jgi:hypothetical protein
MMSGTDELTHEPLVTREMFEAAAQLPAAVGVYAPHPVPTRLTRTPGAYLLRS